MINFISEGQDDGTYAIILSMDELVREYLRANPFTFKRWAVQYAKEIVALNVESFDACIDFPELPDIRFDADWETMIVIRLQRTLLTALQQIQEGHQSVDNCLEELRNELAKRKHEHRLLNRDLQELLEATSEAE